MLLFLKKGNKPPNTVWHFESKCALQSFDLVYGQRQLVTRTRMPGRIYAFLRHANILGHFMSTNTFSLCPSTFLIKAGWEAICSLCIWFIVAFICYVWSDDKECSFSVYVLFKKAKNLSFLKKLLGMIYFVIYYITTTLNNIL